MKVIVLGGGSAGWMTASTLIKAFPNYDITVIESPDTPISGVGESTVAGIKAWTHYLGIDDKDFLKSTDGTYKLSIKFTDFHKKGTHFHYPFGYPNVENNHYRVQDWFLMKMFVDVPNHDFADCMYPVMALVNENKFDPNWSFDGFHFKHHTAYHFDAAKFGVWLREKYCLPRGVKHIVEHITDIKQNEEGIESLNGHTADLFIDCTGFQALLIDKTLKEPFESLEHMLPNNSAWATQMPYKDKEAQMEPFTNCTAIDNGWVWNIPLWSRIGTGYVYSDKFISDEDALQQFKDYLGEGSEDLTYKKIKMRTGVHRRLWVKNVVAIGLSSGFIEPLESNGLITTHDNLFHLIRMMQRPNENNRFSQLDKDQFTYMCKAPFKAFAEFVAQHYALSLRDDTPYWMANLNKTWDESLYDPQPFIRGGFNESAYDKAVNLYFSEDRGFLPIAAGMGWTPTEWDWYRSREFIHEENKKDEKRNWTEVIKNLHYKKGLWRESVANLPTLYQWLDREIYRDDF